jgi:glycolate oxidase FAD binding subunit
MSTVWELTRSAESRANSDGLSLEYRIGAARGTLDLLVEAMSDQRQEKDPERGAAARLTAFLADLRREAGQVEGALTLRDGLTHLAPGFDAWGPIGSSLQIMRRIRERFDPGKVLNPGRFVGGI